MSSPVPRPRVLALPALLLVLAAIVGGCGGDDPPGDSGPGAPTGAGESITVDGGGDAILWGEGGAEQGVVLAHGSAFDAASWEAQATEIAAAGNVVLAVEDTAPESILAAGAHLRDEEGVDAVVMIGASSGADATLQALVSEPDAAEQLITISVNGAVDGLGPEPKLFIVSEDDPVAAASMTLAKTAEGNENELLVLPGSTHSQAIFEEETGEQALSAILDRLEQPTRATQGGPPPK